MTKYLHIAWITNLSEDIKNDFINTEGLCFNLDIDKGGNRTDELFTEIISALNGITTSPNLLVIDNADATLSKYYDYLPSQPKWHILVTSREKVEMFDLQEIGFLTPEEAVDLFLQHYKLGKIPKDSILALVQAVEYHTLTVEILAKAAQLQRFDIEILHHALEKDLKANVHIEHKGEKIERITSYLCSIFDMSALSTNEIWLLKQFTCLPPEYHTYDTLKELLTTENSEIKDWFSETISNLSEKGWLLVNKDTDSYTMHRIIADVVSIKHPIVLGCTRFD